MTIIDKITVFCKYVNNKHFFFNCLGIKSTAGLKTFMEEWNGHNAFAYPLMFDELLQ